MTYESLDIYAYRYYPVLHREMINLYITNQFDLLKKVIKYVDTLREEWEAMKSIGQAGGLSYTTRPCKEKLLLRHYHYHKNKIFKIFNDMVARSLNYFNKTWWRAYREHSSGLQPIVHDINRLQKRIDIEEKAYITYKKLEEDHPNSPLLETNGRSVFRLIEQSLMTYKLHVQHKLDDLNDRL